MNKRTILTIGLAVGLALILLAYGLILRGILLERQQQADLEMQLEPLEALLDGQGEGGQALATRQAELAALQAKLASAELAFPSQVDSTAVVDYIVTAADNNGVSLRRIEARDPLTGTIGGSEYTAFVYEVEVEGGLETIPNFLAALESGAISTLSIDQIHLEAQPPPAPEYRATLTVQVYVRR